MSDEFTRDNQGTDNSVFNNTQSESVGTSAPRADYSDPAQTYSYGQQETNSAAGVSLNKTETESTTGGVSLNKETTDN
ncbi:MAG: hypothetical protein II250_00405, partial [Agathobacter sp.]|nr:hypothetical protein [Agathobacter sp.]